MAKENLHKKQNKRKRFQKIVIYAVLGAFLITSILSGIAGLGVL